MTNKEKLNMLEELLDIEENTLQEDARLDEINQWDSMSVISLIALFDDTFERVITPEEIKEFVTIKDIIDEMDRGDGNWQQES
ncbi:MAG: acyl carrier protein [Bacillota bacterium]|nr:acyl carrier protein [Bacillota bacterium]